MQDQTYQPVVMMLELTEKEAEMLHGMIQNPVGYSPEDEPEEIRHFRACLFAATSQYAT